MSGAIAGPGFLLQKGDGATPTENFTTVTEVKDITGPGVKVDTTDVTNQSSPGGWEEVIPSIRRGGEVTFDCHFQPGDATHNTSTGLYSDMNNRTNRNWKIIIPNQSLKVTFAGFLTALQWKMPVAGVMVASVTIKVTGQPTWA